jgi:hypothetical protein
MTRLVMRLLAATITSTALLILPLVRDPGGLPGTSCALADGAAHAAIIVQHSDGRAGQRVCVGFNGAAIGAEQTLAGSGLEYQTAFYPAVQGNAVCQVDYEPNGPGPWTSDNCLGNQYWGLYVSRRGGRWSSSPVGVSDLVLGDGDALGLTFGSRPPAPPSPQGVCPSPQPSASPAGQAGGPPVGGVVGGGGLSRGGLSSPATSTSGSSAVGSGTGQAAGSGSPRSNDRGQPSATAGTATRPAAAQLGGAATNQATGLQRGLERAAGLTAAAVAIIAMAGLMVFNLVRGGRGS